MATVKVAVVSCEERQLRFWVRGVEGSYKKVGLILPVTRSADAGFRMDGLATSRLHHPILGLLPLPVFYPFYHTSTNLNPLQYHLDPQEDHLKAGRKPGDPGFGIEPPDRHGIFPLPLFPSLLPSPLLSSPPIPALQSPIPPPPTTPTSSHHPPNQSSTPHLHPQLNSPAPKGSLTTPPSSSSSAHPVSTPHPSISPPPTYAAFYAPLARALAREGEVPVKAEEARDVIRLIELAGRSSSEGRTLGV